MWLKPLALLLTLLGSLELVSASIVSYTVYFLQPDRNSFTFSSASVPSTEFLDRMQKAEVLRCILGRFKAYSCASS